MAEESMVSSRKIPPKYRLLTSKDLPAMEMRITPATGKMQNSACRRVGYSFKNRAPVPMVTTGTTANTRPEMVELVYKMP